MVVFLPRVPEPFVGLDIAIDRHDRQTLKNRHGQAMLALGRLPRLPSPCPRLPRLLA
jgi:hypothetical protein